MKMTDEHILLFENEKGLKRIMTLLLRQAEMRVSSSDRADRALDLIRAARNEGDEVSVVIVDVSYPNPEGEKLLSQLQEERDNPPAIVITQYGNENSIAGVRNMEKLALLAAPFESADLLKSIRKATLQTDTQKFISKQHN